MTPASAPVSFGPEWERQPTRQHHLDETSRILAAMQGRARPAEVMEDPADPDTTVPRCSVPKLRHGQSASAAAALSPFEAMTLPATGSPASMWLTTAAPLPTSDRPVPFNASTDSMRADWLHKARQIASDCERFRAVMTGRADFFHNQLRQATQELDAVRRKCDSLKAACGEVRSAVERLETAYTDLSRQHSANLESATQHVDTALTGLSRLISSEWNRDDPSHPGSSAASAGAP